MIRDIKELLPLEEKELYWVAGLLEGEGCFTLKDKKQSIRSSIQIQCHMTDKDIIYKLFHMVGVGSVTGPYSNGVTLKGDLCSPRYCFRVSGNNAYEIMKLILPIMGERRKKIIEKHITEYIKYDRKVFKFLNILTGDIEETYKAKEWYDSHNVSEGNMYRTMTGKRTSNKGWKRLQ